MESNNKREEEPATNPRPEGGEGGTALPSSEAVAAPAAASSFATAYEKTLAENKELHDRLLRKQAEMDNFRKRTHREKEELREYAAENVIRSLLPTLDGFERALQRRDENVPEAFYQGLELIYKGMLDVLTRAGLAPLHTVGAVFDPHLHQAVETVEAPGHREHEVVEEMQRGYKLKNKLLRPAIVKVAVGGKD